MIYLNKCPIINTVSADKQYLDTKKILGVKPKDFFIKNKLNLNGFIYQKNGRFCDRRNFLFLMILLFHKKVNFSTINQ